MAVLTISMQSLLMLYVVLLYNMVKENNKKNQKMDHINEPYYSFNVESVLDIPQFPTSVSHPLDKKQLSTRRVATIGIQLC